MKFLIRLWCLLFGHTPDNITITYERENGSTLRESKDLLVLQPAQNCNPLVLNLCRVCGEPSRHLAREPHYAKLIAEGIAAEKAKKVAEEAAANVGEKSKPLPPSPAPFETRTRKLRSVPKQSDKPPPTTPAPAKPSEAKK